MSRRSRPVRSFRSIAERPSGKRFAPVVLILTCFRNCVSRSHMPNDAKPQHLFATMLASVQAATAAVLGSGADISRIVVEPPRDPTHGDMATNAAMVLAKDAGKKPRELAESIAARLRSDGKVASVDIAGP